MKRKIRASKAFTLAELLVVVAIIAVLVAVSIPVFAAKLEKSREATDIANVRSAYARVKVAAVSGEDGTGEVKINSKGTYYMFVSLVQKQEDWQTDKISIGGIQPTDTAHWRETPQPDGTCKVTCKADGETILYWNGGPGYKPASVADSAKPYEPAINAVLSTLYDVIVEDRLDSANNHISYVLFNGGKVTGVSCYSSEKDKGGGTSAGLTAAELDALNEKIKQALNGTGYKLPTNTTERIFFDWNGNVVTNYNSETNKYNGIGGQWASGSLSFVSDKGGKNVGVSYKTGKWTAN